MGLGGRADRVTGETVNYVMLNALTKSALEYQYV